VSSTAPEKMKAAPIPAIARPTMKAVEVGAAPQMTEPTSKTRIDHKKVHLTEYNWYTLPEMGLKQAQVKAYELPYQPMSSRESKASVILGIAGVRMVRSCRTVSKLSRHNGRLATHESYKQDGQVDGDHDGPELD
jgi:hypothetical protein